MKRIISKGHIMLTMALCAIFVIAGMSFAFAASNTMNPTLSISYEVKDGKTVMTLRANAPDDKTAAILDRAVLDTGDKAYRLDESVEVDKRLSQDDIANSRVSAGDKLYKLSLINKEALKDEPEKEDVAKESPEVKQEEPEAVKETPETASETPEAASETPEAAKEEPAKEEPAKESQKAEEKKITLLRYELIPSDEEIKDMIEVADHEKKDLILKDTYFVNEDEVTAEDYENVRMTECFFEEKPDTYTNIKEIEPMKETLTFEGKDAQKINRWVRDRYFHYEETAVSEHHLYILTGEADELMLSVKGSECAKSSYLPLMARQKSAGYKETTLTWSPVNGAYKYMVYRTVCGKSSYKRVGDTTDTGFTVRNLKKRTYYKYIIVAVDKHGKVLTASPSIHVTTKGGSHKNPRNLAVKKPNMSLKAGKSAKIKKKINYGGVKVHVGLRYVSSDSSVATVNKTGKIIAKGAGTCSIIVYAQNGISKVINLTVR